MLHYRSILLVSSSWRDLKSLAPACFEVGEPVVRTVDGIEAVEFRRSDRGVDDLLAVVRLDAESSLVVLQQSAPDEIEPSSAGGVPTFARMALKWPGSRLGGLSSVPFLSGDEIVTWLEGDLPGVVAAIVTDDTDMPEAARQLEGNVAGMASLAIIDQEQADRVSIHLAAPGKFRAGGFISLVRLGGIVRYSYVPATVVRVQRSGAVQRIRRWCLRQMKDWPLSDPARAMLEALRKSEPGAGDVGEYLDEIDNLERRLIEADSDRELSVLELDETLRELDDAQNVLRYCQRRLQELGEYSFVGADQTDEPDSVQPSSCADAISLAAELLPNVVITAPPEPVAGLDESEQSFCFATKVWMGLRALNSYATSKANGSHQGGFYEFCTDPPPAATAYFANHVAMQESESTGQRERTREARIFSVPREVDTSGRVYMEAHLKISQSGVAPRLHFLDHTAKSGRIFVGYIGPHLPTGG